MATKPEQDGFFGGNTRVIECWKLKVTNIAQKNYLKIPSTIFFGRSCRYSFGLRKTTCFQKKRSNL